MRRIQVHIGDDLDDWAEAEAARRGVSKAALIRASLARELQSATASPTATDPWQALSGWLADDPIDDLDEPLYG